MYFTLMRVIVGPEPRRDMIVGYCGPELEDAATTIDNMKGILVHFGDLWRVEFHLLIKRDDYTTTLRREIFSTEEPQLEREGTVVPFLARPSTAAGDDGRPAADPPAKPVKFDVVAAAGLRQLRPVGAGGAPERGS